MTIRMDMDLVDFLMELDFKDLFEYDSKKENSELYFFNLHTKNDDKFRPLW